MLQVFVSSGHSITGAFYKNNVLKSEKKNMSKIVREYDQEIPQSQTADKP